MNVETYNVARVFDVSITLLGSPRQLICQCCGMPLEDGTMSRETDGSFNEDYCKWCYADGEFKYDSEQQLIDFCVCTGLRSPLRTHIWKRSFSCGTGKNKEKRHGRPFRRKKQETDNRNITRGT